jgi:50S ribosomal subunit-associated GTPase HflX
VLFDIGASAKPVVTVYNKIDLNRDFLLPQTSDSVAVSAVSGENIEELKRLIIKKLFEQNLP